MAKAFRWTKRLENLRSMIEDRGAEDTWKFIREVVRDAARDEKWRDSEKACALADWVRDINAVCKQLGVEGIPSRG